MILIIFSTPIFGFLFGARFIPAATLMSTSLLIYIPRMIPSGALLQYLDHRRALLWIGMIEFSFIVIALLLISSPGNLMHIVWIILGGSFLEKGLQMIVLARTNKVSIKDYIPIFWFVLFAVLLILSWCIQWYVIWN
jgi:hypothetical protein